MIADEVGFTKAAIYYHFRTREQLLCAVLEPILDQLRAVIETAESLRTAAARAEHMVSGYATLAAGNRALVSVLAGDPGVVEELRRRPDWADLIDRQMALLADADPGPAGLVRAAVVFSGIAGAAAPALGDVDADTLAHQLADAGRRTLGLRTPRTTGTKPTQGRTRHAR
jgi:AcrR family transcriptional regulator